VIAIEDHDTILGLAVEKIGDIVWLDIEQMKMPNHFFKFQIRWRRLSEENVRWVRIKTPCDFLIKSLLCVQPDGEPLKH